VKKYTTAIRSSSEHAACLFMKQVLGEYSHSDCLCRVMIISFALVCVCVSSSKIRQSLQLTVLASVTVVQ